MEPVMFHFPPEPVVNRFGGIYAGTYTCHLYAPEDPDLLNPVTVTDMDGLPATQVRVTNFCREGFTSDRCQLVLVEDNGRFTVMLSTRTFSDA
jgi:hypothetical protein